MKKIKINFSLGAALLLTIIASFLLWLPFYLGYVDRFLEDEIIRKRNAKVELEKVEFANFLKKAESSNWKRSVSLCKSILVNDPKNWGARTFLTLYDYSNRQKFPRGSNIKHIEIKLQPERAASHHIAGVLTIHFSIEFTEDERSDDTMINYLRGGVGESFLFEKRIPSQAVPNELKPSQQEHLQAGEILESVILFGEPMLGSFRLVGSINNNSKLYSHKIDIPFIILPVRSK